MAQAILDLFPDFASEYGLIGVGLFSLAIADMAFATGFALRLALRRI